jgi:hypothetical protein
MQPWHIFGGLAAIGGAFFLLNTSHISIPEIPSILPATKVDRPTAAADADTATLLRSDLSGEFLASPGLALAGSKVALVTDALESFRPVSPEDAPAGVTDLAILKGCSFARPRAGQKIANVKVGGSPVETSIQSYSDTDVAKAAMGWLEWQKDHPELDYAIERNLPVASIRLVDVVLTDTTSPQYLVLQSASDGILWNLHLAPGVTVAHVAMVAQGDTGLVNPDPAVKVEVLRTDLKPECNAEPVFEPGDDWGFVRNTKEGMGDQALLARHVERFAAYDAWFTKTFGQSARQDLVGFREAAHLLVGPLPDPASKVPQVVFNGASVAMTPQDNILFGPAVERSAQMTAQMESLLGSAIGGDLAMLVAPTPVIRKE